jgi:hypothetical protein
MGKVQTSALAVTSAIQLRVCEAYSVAGTFLASLDLFVVGVGRMDGLTLRRSIGYFRRSGVRVEKWLQPIYIVRSAHIDYWPLIGHLIALWQIRLWKALTLKYAVGN